MRCLGLLTICLWLPFCTQVQGLEPVIVAVGDSTNLVKQPQATWDATGKIHLTYGQGDTVWYCTSTDAGVSFQQPVRAFQIPNMSLGMRRGPRIAIAGKTIVITAIGGKQGRGRDGDLLAYHSADEGKSWQGPVRVNDAQDSAREGLHAMAAGPDGSIWCLWLDLRNKRTELFMSHSQDQGRNWQPNILAYRAPAGSICECCHPSLVIGPSRMDLLFRNSIAGNRDMYAISSRDSGKSFSPAMKLGNESWKLAGCPMDGGMITYDVRQKTVSVYRRKDQIFSASEDSDEERSLGPGDQPWVATTPLGPVFAWTKSSELLILEPGAESPTSISNNARDPVIVSGPGNESHCLVLWESKTEGTTAIVAKPWPLAREKP